MHRLLDPQVKRAPKKSIKGIGIDSFASSGMRAVLRPGTGTSSPQKDARNSSAFEGAHGLTSREAHRRDGLRACRPADPASAKAPPPRHEYEYAGPAAGRPSRESSHMPYSVGEAVPPAATAAARGGSAPDSSISGTCADLNKVSPLSLLVRGATRSPQTLRAAAMYEGAIGPTSRELAVQQRPRGRRVLAGPQTVEEPLVPRGGRRHVVYDPPPPPREHRGKMMVQPIEEAPSNIRRRYSETLPIECLHQRTSPRADAPSPTGALPACPPATLSPTGPAAPAAARPARLVPLADAPSAAPAAATAVPHAAATADQVDPLAAVDRCRRERRAQMLAQP